jgi:hypothetical protein
MKNIIMSLGALLILASCSGETAEVNLEETVVDTTVVESTENFEEEVETEGEIAMEE